MSTCTTGSPASSSCLLPLEAVTLAITTWGFSFRASSTFTLSKDPASGLLAKRGNRSTRAGKRFMSGCPTIRSAQPSTATSWVAPP